MGLDIVPDFGPLEAGAGGIIFWLGRGAGAAG
jgi:hypothetical protein